MQSRQCGVTKDTAFEFGGEMVHPTSQKKKKMMERRIGERELVT